MSVSRDTTTTHVLSDDATFRAWAQSIHDRLAAVGLTNTSDTGQINLATVTRPTAGNDGGYEIWKFNDDQQAADPIYFKIFYGTAGAGVTRPRIYVIIGTGSNGSGTISGTTLDFFNDLTVAQPGRNGSGAGTLHVAYSSGALVIMGHQANGTPTDARDAYGILIERIRSPHDASFKGSGAVCGVCTATASSASSGLRHISKDANGKSTVTSSNTPGVGFIVPVGTNTNDSGTLHYAAAIIPNTRRPECPLIGLVGLKTGEVTDGDTGAISIGGVSRQYRQMGFPLSANVADSTPTFGATVLNE